MNNNQSTWFLPLKCDRGDYFPKQGFHQATNVSEQIDEGLFYIGEIMIRN